MAVAMLMEFPGVTREQYDAVIEELNLGGRPGAGGIFHVAGPTETGWRVVDVWESEDAFDVFFRGKLDSALQNAGVQPPHVSAWPVHNTLG